MIPARVSALAVTASCAVLLAVPPNLTFAWLYHPSQLWRESWYFWWHMVPWLPERWLLRGGTPGGGEPGLTYLRRTWHTSRGEGDDAPSPPAAYVASVAAVLAQEPVVLPPWDPMGSLACSSRI